MKYCIKCKHLYNDNKEQCADCKKTLREITDKTTPVYLLTASDFEIQRVRAALDDSKIPCAENPVKHNSSPKTITGFDNGTCDIIVPFSAYQKAYDVCVGIGAIKINENESGVLNFSSENADPLQDEEEFEEMSSAKRTTVRIVSAILLILLFAGVIYVTDFITGMIRNLFG